MHSLDSPPTPLSPDHTIKRLHFEDILLDMSPRAHIRREFDTCVENVPDPTELLESLKITAAQYADVDPSKLWEEYLRLKREFILTRAENLFLESYLDPESPAHDGENDLQAVEDQLAELRSMSSKETEEITSLIGTFAEAMENFPQLIESVLNHFDECDRKFELQRGIDQSEDEKSKSISCNNQTDADPEYKVRELQKLAQEVETKIIELDVENSTLEEYYQQLRSLHDTNTKLDLLRKVITFFSDWIIESCEENLVIFSFRGSALKRKRVISNKHHQLTKDFTYKVHVKVEMKSLFVKDAQIEPKDEAPPIDDILKEMAFRRMMHTSVASFKTHNDLEFLLRRVSQRICTLSM